MRLVRFGERESERPGLLGDDGVIHDVSAFVEDFGPAFFGSGGVSSLQNWIQQHRANTPTIAVEDVRIGPPIARPGKVVCVGVNYRRHAEEAGMPVPDEPIVFFKAPNAITGPYDDIQIPIGSVKTDWEVEIGVVIGSEARYLPSPEVALDIVAGYTITNDLSERELQLERGGQWVKGKSFETFNPLGPWFVTADEVADPQRLQLNLSVNGEVMQSGSAEDMIFPIAHLVWYLSQVMVLEPGDLVNTGTPAGVGMGLQPPRYLRKGDLVEAAIAGFGHQRQLCVDAEI